VVWIVGLRICEILSWLRYESRPLELAMRAKSTGHFTGERTGVASLDCL
jgi:hypothetical protein